MALLADLVTHCKGATSFGDLLLLVRVEGAFSEVTRNRKFLYYTLQNNLCNKKKINLKLVDNFSKKREFKDDKNL